MKIYVQSKTGKYNAVITSVQETLDATLTWLRLSGGYYVMKKEVKHVVPFEEIECIREFTEADV